MADPTPLRRLYNLVKGRGKGHSDDHLPALESSYIEALAMARSAIDAIEAVKNGRKTNRIRTSTNHKKAQMLLKMFGIRAAGFFHPMSAEDLAYLHEIQGMCGSSQDGAMI